MNINNNNDQQVTMAQLEEFDEFFDNDLYLEQMADAVEDNLETIAPPTLTPQAQRTQAPPVGLEI